MKTVLCSSRAASTRSRTIGQGLRCALWRAIAVGLFPLFLLAGASAHAAKPVCSTHSGGPYCQYEGKVALAYVNAGNLVILYFDEAFGSASEVNLSNVSVLNACTVDMGANPSFGKMFYASLLAAQAGQKTVSVQMHSSASGYPVCDRIWVHS